MKIIQQNLKFTILAKCYQIWSNIRKFQQMLMKSQTKFWSFERSRSVQINHANLIDLLDFYTFALRSMRSIENLQAWSRNWTEKAVWHPPKPRFSVVPEAFGSGGMQRRSNKAGPEAPASEAAGAAAAFSAASFPPTSSAVSLKGVC